MVKLLTKTFVALGLLLIIFTFKSEASAQSFISGSSTDLLDGKALFTNPALVSYQTTRVLVGAKAYHVGFGSTSGVPFRQGLFAFSSPFLIMDRIGLGATVQYFTSPIYGRLQVGLVASGRILPWLSAGVEVSALNIGYDQNEFDLVDQNDPVFANGGSKTTMTIAAGVYAQPFSFLSLAAGGRHLNQPDLSLVGDGVVQPRRFFLGATAKFGGFRGTIERHIVQNNSYTQIYFGLYSTVGNFVQAKSNLESFTAEVEGQMHLGNIFSVNYVYSVPFNELNAAVPTADFGNLSKGSHLFTVLIEPARRKPDPWRNPIFNLDFHLPDVTEEVSPRIFLDANAEQIHLFEKQIVREIADDVPEEFLRGLSPYELEMMDNSYAGNNISYQAPDSLVPDTSNIIFEEALTDNYQSAMQTLRQHVRNHGNVEIVSPENSLAKAEGLRNRIQDDDKLPAGEVELVEVQFQSREDSLYYVSGIDFSDVNKIDTVIAFTPSRLNVTTYPVNFEGETKRWWMMVLDANQNQVRAIEGEGEIPTQLQWDWKRDDNQFIDPGVYLYYVGWENANGETFVSNRRRVYVQKLLRKITIEITRDAEALEGTDGQYRLLIKQ